MVFTASSFPSGSDIAQEAALPQGPLSHLVLVPTALYQAFSPCSTTMRTLSSSCLGPTILLWIPLSPHEHPFYTFGLCCSVGTALPFRPHVDFNSPSRSVGIGVKDLAPRKATCPSLFLNPSLAKTHIPVHILYQKIKGDAE